MQSELLVRQANLDDLSQLARLFDAYRVSEIRSRLVASMPALARELSDGTAELEIELHEPGSAHFFTMY